MTDRPPRNGEPLYQGEYRGKQVYIYPAGPAPPEIQSSSSHISRHFKNTWCGYVETERPADEYEVDSFEAYGGITYAEDCWIGFDTVHVFGSKPRSIAEMKAEVERLADQVIAYEAEQGIVEQLGVELETDDEPGRG